MDAVVYAGAVVRGEDDGLRGLFLRSVILFYVSPAPSLFILVLVCKWQHEKQLDLRYEAIKTIVEE